MSGIIKTIIYISLFLLLFILPDSIGCFIFLFLVLKLIGWLFGPAQDMQDDYYYDRYMRAKERYERRER